MPMLGGHQKPVFADTGRDEDSMAVLQMSSSPVLALLLHILFRNTSLRVADVLIDLLIVELR